MHKNIIFDCGNVLFEWNPEQLAKDFTNNEEDKKIILDTFFKLWPILDTGALSDESFKEMIYMQVPKRLYKTVDDLLENWYFHLPKIEDMHNLVIKLKENHNIYLLSNIPTSFSHNYKKIDILKYFDGFVFSAENKVMKPDYEIYKLILSKYNLNAEDCLFIDDSLINVTMAKKVGIESFLFNKNNINELISFLKENKDI